MTTLVAIKRQIQTELQSFGIEEWRREADLIVEHVTGNDAARQILESQSLLSPEQGAQIRDILACRKEHVPLQYCLGKAWFAGLVLGIKKGVFIPRTDTETILTVVGQCLDKLGVIDADPRDDLIISEIGIGSGAIAIGLLKLFQSIRVDACDINPLAIEVTRQNAMQHDVESRLSLRCGDWRQLLPHDLLAIVSNPPYIPLADKAKLAIEVAGHEPHEALFGSDSDGLGFYRELAEIGKSHLRNNRGFVVVEVGDGQAADVQRIFAEKGWHDIKISLDINGLERVVSSFAE